MVKMAPARAGRLYLARMDSRMEARGEGVGAAKVGLVGERRRVSAARGVRRGRREDICGGRIAERGGDGEEGILRGLECGWGVG